MRGRPAFTRRKNSHGNFYFLNVALTDKKKKKAVYTSSMNRTFGWREMLL
jgi:hypothetical protein